MTYYEKLVKKINQSMEAHPRSAMAMDMDTFRIVAKGADLAALNKKISGKTPPHTLIFQKPNQKASWVL
jgi:hypothetical protein